jgi:Zn-dependent protease
MTPVSEILYTIGVWLLPVLFAITLHEAAHGWVAYRLGDSTAKKLGRITANPLKHIDPMGTIVVPIILALVSPFIIGWAKPVPVDARQFKSPLVDMGLVAVAGPVSNFMMACIWAFLIVIVSAAGSHSVTTGFLIEMGQNGILINTILMVLNLLPILPLDGGRVLAGVLPPAIARPYLQLEPYGMFIVIGLLVSGILGKILWPLVVHFVKIISAIFGL